MILPSTYVPNSKLVNAIIETPANSSVKYKYEPDGKYFRMNKVLPAGFCFPVDFGFLPGTKAQDGDPLDILVLNDFPAQMGAILHCRVLGVIIAEQKDKQDFV